MNGIFFVFIGLAIFEGVNTHPGSKRNDTKMGSINHKHHRNMARRSIYYDKKDIDPKSDSSKENTLESVVLAIDTGVKKFMSSKNKPDFVDSIAKTLLDLAKKSANNPVYRSKGHKYDIRPELVRFNDEKPSVLLEINSDAIIKSLKDLLQSKTAHKLMEKFSKEAAVVYRSIKYELDKGKNERSEQE